MDLLDRLHRRLIEMVQREYPEGVDRPLTIGDIYQNLVPYRGVRAELGFSELTQYERVLLRLLSGERDYLQIERPEVREEFRRELGTPNPILGLYRDYAAVVVFLKSVIPTPPLSPPLSPDPVPTAGTVAVSAEESDIPLLDPEPGAALNPALACRSCRAPLPAARDVRFCPFCGSSQHPSPCTECSAPLEPEWRFCIRCGAARQPPYRE